MLPRWMDLVLLPAFNLALALLVAGAVVAAVGMDPLQVVGWLVKGAFGSRSAVSYTLYYATTFVFTGLAVAVAFHIGELAAAAAQLFHHRALVVVGHINGEVFIRLAFFAVDVAIHHARLGHGQFEAFAAHVFQQNRQVQFAAARDFKHIRIRGVPRHTSDVLVSVHHHANAAKAGWHGYVTLGWHLACERASDFLLSSVVQSRRTAATRSRARW